MKKTMKSMLGVTLLEIMLVLAIAAMVIVMSVRYYQTATQSQQANAVLQMLQGVTAAADGLAQGSGTYSSVSSDDIASLMPGGNLNLPWGGVVTIDSFSSDGYNVSVAGTDAQTGICVQIKSRLAGNPKYVDPTCAEGTLTYTYDRTK